jgi:hypothetical protein
MDWTELVTQPLGLAGFALAIVFAIASRLMVRKSPNKVQWMVPAAYALAALSAVGGLVLAHQHTSTPMGTTSPARAEFRGFSQDKQD